jgi:plastocyanin
MSSINRRHFGMLVVATALLPAGAARADDIAIHIDNFVFEPAQLTVKAGQTVTWTNRDDIPHTVVCAGKFRSKTMDTDGTFSFTFTSAGEYKYFCSLHPHMTGVIKVEWRDKPGHHIPARPVVTARPGTPLFCSSRTQEDADQRIRGRS